MTSFSPIQVSRRLRRFGVFSMAGFFVAVLGLTEQPGLPSVTVRFELVAMAPSRLVPSGVMEIREQGSRIVAHSLEVIPSQTPSIALPAQGSWEVTPKLPGFWGRRTSFTVTGAGLPTQRIEVWPLGRISGRIRMADRRLARPPKVSVATLTPPRFVKRNAAPLGLLDCPVGKDGSWSCELPVATFDLAVSAEGFTPHYYWENSVPAAGALDLGEIELRRSASVSGWVAVDGGALDPEHCIARLLPMSAAQASGAMLEKLRRSAVRGRVQKDGFFQIAGARPGHYALEIVQPGFTPARLQPLRISEGLELALREPLLLQRPIDLVFTIKPPLDSLGRPWRAQILRASAGTGRYDQTIYDDPVLEEGRLRFEGQQPGLYAAYLTDSAGNRMLARRGIRIESAADSAQALEVQFVVVEGTVRLGDLPLAGDLWFGGRRGAEAVRFRSNEEGRFEGILPREGLWAVEVEATNPPLQARKDAQVEADGKGRAELALRFPETRIEGRVVDERGRPQPGAIIELSSTEATVPAIAAREDGTFEAWGIPVGPLLLGATAFLAGGSENLRSDPVEITVVENQRIGPVELTLRRLLPWSAVVESAGEPVSGAVVQVVAESPRLLGGGAETTDMAGAFAVELPANASAVTAVVQPPVGSLQAFALVKKAGERLRLSGSGGTLELDLGGAAPSLRRETVLEVTQNGLILPFGTLARWALQRGASEPAEDRSVWRIPDLAPGFYRACLGARNVQGQIDRSPDSARVPSCVEGELATGGVLQLAPGQPGPVR